MKILKDHNKGMALVFIMPTLFLVLFSWFVYKNVKYFEYDSDGDVLNFINRGMFISNFINYRENRAEFPKVKLSHYKINDYVIYRTLNVYVKTKNHRVKRLRFNITFLNKKKIKALKSSLNKVIRNNKKALNARS
ncbi:hypothetical protein [Sungkyunkwania multivorans]